MRQFFPNLEVLQRFLDYIVDGKYVEELRDLTLHFKGSSNQRIIDVKKSIENNNVTTIEWLLLFYYNIYQKLNF